MSRTPTKRASPSDRAPHRGLSALAAASPLLVCIVSGVVLLSASGGLENLREMLGLGGVLAYGALAAAAAALGLNGLLARFSAAARVPGVLIALFAALPWLLGLAAWRVGLASVLDALRVTDPSMHAALMAAGFREVMIGKLVGNLVGAAILGGSGLALALASLAPRAERRKEGIAVGVLCALPALAIAIHALQVFGEHALPLAAATALALVSAACAGGGAANDAPHARAASLAAASSALSLSSIACAAMALPALVERDLLQGMSSVAPLARMSALRGAAPDAEHAALLTWASVGAALVIPLALSAWAARRARPDGAAWAGAAMLALWVSVPIGLDAYAVEASRRDAQVGCARPWDAMPAFEALELQAEAYEVGRAVDLVVGPEMMRDRLGGRTPSADLDEGGAGTAARIDALLASPPVEPELEPEWEPDPPDWLDEDGPVEPTGRLIGGSSTPALSVAVHQGTSAARSLALLSALERARIEAFDLVGAPPGELPPDAPAHLCFLLEGPGYVTVLLRDASFMADETEFSVGELHEGGLRVTRADGERVTLTLETPFSDQQRWRRQIVFARFDGDMQGLAAGAIAARRGGYELMVSTREAPPALALGGAPPALDQAPGPAPGALTREAILETVRAHSAQTRLCYERALRRDPSAAGRVVVMILIASSGAVRAAPIQESTLSDSEAEACLTQEIETWTFPAHSGDALGVSIPFVFSPST